MLLNVTAVLVLFAVLLWIRWRRKKFSVFKELGIPGPEPSIFFGNVLEMVRKKPVPCEAEWVKKYGDVFGYFYGTFPTLVVADVDLIKQILVKDFQSFSDRPVEFFGVDLSNPDQPNSQHMINKKGKEWKEARSLITPSFTTGKLKQMIPLLKDSVSLMVSKLESASGDGSKDVEMYSLYKGMTMDAINRVAFGVETPIQDEPNHPLMFLSKLLLSARFTSIMNVLLVSFREFNFLLRPVEVLTFLLFNKGKNPMEEIFERLGQMVKLRKENPSSRRPDILQTLIDARANKDDITDSSLTASAETSETVSGKTDQDPARVSKNNIQLSDIEVQANVFLFFLAGYETTSTALAYLTHYLLNNIPIQDKIREEILELFEKDGNLDYDLLMKMHYTDRVISESLRMNPPIYSFVNRVASRDVQLGKWKVPAGMTVQIPVYYLHKRDEHFTDPASFDPDRFLAENRGPNHTTTWLPFGAGPRNCVGMRLALLEMKMALVTMLRKFKLEPCGRTEMGSIEISYGVGVASPMNGVYVRAVPL